jgi:hypothetical protein
MLQETATSNQDKRKKAEARLFGHGRSKEAGSAWMLQGHVQVN